MSKLLDTITELVSGMIEENGCELVDIEYRKEGENKVLRFFVDLIDGHISLDECAMISNKISTLLDEEDPITENYILEVSSPGVERPLNKPKDYERFNGYKIDVSLFEAINKKKKFTCVLKDFKDNQFTFTLDDEDIFVPMEKVAKINLHFEF